MALVAGTFLGPYEILAPLGAGGMGEVYRARDARLGREVALKGTDQLWIRPLESLSAQRLAGTEGASFPFWSPDSRSIGFFAGGKLKRIETSGGPAQTLCDAGVFWGGTWNREGVILFASLGFGLFRVPASGGTPSLVVPVDWTRQMSQIHSPAFLPDGRHFLFNLRTARPEARGIYVGSLDGGENRRLLDAGSNGVYAPPGYLLFMREGALQAQPFDARKLELAGETAVVTGQVGRAANFPRGSFSVSDNGVMIYDPSTTRQSKQLVWANREGKPIGSLGALASWSHPALSPDERRFVVDRLDEQADSNDLWLYDSAGGSGSRFTFDPADDVFPVWSPDGSRIIWSSTRSGAYDLYQKSATGAGADELVLKSDKLKFPNDWSPDGRFIVFYQIDPKTRRDLWLLPQFGDRKPFPFLQTEANDVGARISPDGRWIAYASDESGGYEVYVRSFPSGAGRWQVSSPGGAGPQWRRDGKEIYYYSADGKLMAANVKPGETFETGPPRALFEFRSGHVVGTTAPYSVTADGQRFLLSTLVDDSGSAPLVVVLNWTSALKR